LKKTKKNVFFRKKSKNLQKIFILRLDYFELTGYTISNRKGNLQQTKGVES